MRGWWGFLRGDEGWVRGFWVGVGCWFRGWYGGIWGFVCGVCCVIFGMYGIVDFGYDECFDEDGKELE